MFLAGPGTTLSLIPDIPYDISFINQEHEGGKQLHLKGTVSSGPLRSPLGAAVLAIPCMRAAGGSGYDDLSLPLRCAEMRCRYCINNRDDILDTAATGTAFPGIFRNRTRSFLHKDTMKCPPDLINVVKYVVKLS